MTAQTRNMTAPAKVRGFSLIELMIAMTLGLILLAGVTTLVTNTSQSHREVARAGRLMENGRYAMDLLREEARHAGFYGRFTALAAPAAGVDPCATAIADLENGLPYAVQGLDDETGNPALSCLGDDQHMDDTDILVVRRAATAPTAVADLEPGAPYIQAHANQYRLFAASATQSTNEANFDLTERDGSRTPIRRLRVDIYFVSPCKQNSCAGVSDPVPTLKRLELWTGGAAPAFTADPVPLVEGVQNLQIDYGIDRNADGAPDETNPGDGDDYEQLPDDAGEWGNVVALRLNLLVRSVNLSAGHTDEKRYVLGEHGSVGAFDDNFKRHVFSSSARVVNRSSRRET